MGNESVEEYYDRQYRSHDERKVACPHSIHDLAKATRRVNAALGALGVESRGASSKVLDVGSGLGYYTKALTNTGATVTGLDFSSAAVEVARKTFPECNFVRGAWHEDIPEEPQFDLIWTINFSLVNTFDVGFIAERLVKQAMLRLKPGGALVVGWNTDFSGRAIEGYSHWPLPMFKEMREKCGFSAPYSCEAGSHLASWFAVRVAKALKRSIPVFMVRKKQ
jgi:SAM-dependent methyltransferase